MSVKKVGGLVITAFFLQIGVSQAMTPAACWADDQVATEGVSKPVERVVIDRATGLVIRLESGTPGHMTVDVTDGNTSIHKDLQGRTSMTTVAAGGERVSIAFDGKDLQVTGLAQPLRGSMTEPDSLSFAITSLRSNPAVRSAVALLDRLALEPDTPEGNALLLTRALLGSAPSARKIQEWAHRMSAQPKVVRVAQSRGPGQCWDDYSGEALRIFDDYSECFAGCRWYQPFCEQTCEGIYALRSEMAFMWYFNCNGPFYAS
jgi:hypothetical protein